MSNSMKIWKKIIDKRIISKTIVTRNQFGFMPGRSKMEPILVMYKTDCREVEIKGKKIVYGIYWSREGLW